MKNWVLGAVLLVLTILPFKQYFVDKKFPLPYDIQAGMYYPWLNHTFGYAVRPPVKNPILSDTISQFWIWRNRAFTDTKLGRISFWNHFSLSGYEMSPWFHAIQFSPLNIFYFIFETTDAMSLIVISQVFIGLIGTFLLGKKIFRSVFAGLGMSISWIFSSYFVGWLTWGTVSATLAFLPWAIYFFEQYREKHKIRFAILQLFSLVAVILSGHPQTAFYCLGIFAIWTALRKSLGYASLTTLFSVLSCFFVLYPSIFTIKNSIRLLDNHLLGANYGFIDWSQILALLINPNFFGNPATGNYFGSGYNYQEKLIYFGTAPLFFCFLSLLHYLKYRKGGEILKIGFIYILLGLFLSTEYPLGWIVYKLNLPLLSTGPAGRSFIFSVFGACLVFSDTIVKLYKGDIAKETTKATILYYSYIYLVVVGIAIPLKLYLGASIYANTAPFLSIEHNLVVTLRNFVYPVSFFIFTSLSVYSIRSFPKIKNCIIALIILITYLDGMLFFVKYTPFVPKSLINSSSSSIEYLQKMREQSGDFFRVERESSELLPPNMWEVYGLSSTSGYDPISPLSYQKSLLSRQIIGNISRYIENGNSGIDQMGDFGIKYLLALKRDQRGVPSQDGNIREYFSGKSWKEVFTDGPVSLLLNLNFKPPYRLEPRSAGTVDLVEQSNNIWKFRVQVDVPAKLILFENTNESWKAFDNGYEALIETHDGSYKSIKLEEGNHVVSFIYHNVHVRSGLMVSVVSLALYLFLLYKRLIY